MWFLGVVSVPDLARPSNHHPIGFTNLVRCSYSRMNPKLPKPTSGNHLKPQISMSIGTALRWWPLNLMGCLNLPAKSLGDWPSGRVAEPKPTVGQTWTKSKSAQAQRAPSPASLPLRPPNHPCRKEELKNGEKWWENDGKMMENAFFHSNSNVLRRKRLQCLQYSLSAQWLCTNMSGLQPDPWQHPASFACKISRMVKVCGCRTMLKHVFHLSRQTFDTSWGHTDCQNKWFVHA